MKLDIGCGQNKEPGYIGIDNIFNDKVEIVADAEALPVREGSCDEVRCYHVLEHVENPITAVNEAYRVLKKNGVYKIQVPHFSGLAAHADITHIRSFTSLSFDCFSPEKTSLRNITRYGNCKFEILKKSLDYHNLDRVSKQFTVYKHIGVIVVKILNFLANRNIIFTERFWCRWVGGFDHINFLLRKR